MIKDENVNEFLEHVVNIERKLWTNNAVFYKDTLSEDCLLVFPETGVINRDLAVEAIRKENEEGRKWAEVDFDEMRRLRLTDDVALLSYRVTAKWEHEQSAITALATSLYVKRDSVWKLTFHQQTPLAQEPQMSNTVTLEHSSVATRLPVQDLERARLFYAEKLGLEPVEERPGGLLYHCGSGSFALFVSSGAPSGDFTQMAFEVTDLKATVAALRVRGVKFEEFDLPGIKTMDGIAEVEGNYPSKGGVGELAAWFKDSEGNLLGIGQPLR